MGFFLSKNTSFKELLNKTFWKRLIPSLVLIIFFSIFKNWLYTDISLIDFFNEYQFSIVGLFKDIFVWTTSSPTGHLWFLFSYFQIILLYPLLSNIIKDRKVCRYIIFVTIVFMLIKDIQVLLNPEFGIKDYYMMGIPFIYALTGYELYLNKDKFRNNRKLIFIAILIGIICQILRWLLQMQLFKVTAFNDYYYFWNTGLSFIFIICLIIVILSINIKGIRVTNVLEFISKRTFIIYLIHIVVLSYINSRHIAENFMIKIGLNFDFNALTLNQNLLVLSIRFIIVFSISFIIACLFHFIKMYILKKRK